MKHETSNCEDTSSNNDDERYKNNVKTGTQIGIIERGRRIIRIRRRRRRRRRRRQRNRRAGN